MAAQVPSRYKSESRVSCHYNIADTFDIARVYYSLIPICLPRRPSRVFNGQVHGHARDSFPLRLLFLSIMSREEALFKDETALLLFSVQSSRSSIHPTRFRLSRLHWDPYNEYFYQILFSQKPPIGLEIVNQSQASPLRPSLLSQYPHGKLRPSPLPFILVFPVL